MNLYEIDSQIIEAFEQAVDPDTGEIVNAEAYEALDALQMAFSQKAEGILLLIKNLSADAEAYKQEKQAFEARQRAAENRTESLKRYISAILHGEKFSTDKVVVTWRKSEAVEFSGDIQMLPADCVRVKEPEVNRTELKRLLKAGAVIKGASLVTRQNIQIPQCPRGGPENHKRRTNKWYDRYQSYVAYQDFDGAVWAMWGRLVL